MADLLTAATSVVTAAFEWVTTAASTITTTPILQIFCVGVPLVGLGVGLIKRLLSVRG